MLDLNDSAFNLSIANVSIANQSNQSDANQSVVVAIEDEEPTPQRDEPERKSTKGVVRRLSPTSGSLCGGTRLSITGSGFAETPSANRVEIGDTECEIEDVSSDMLVCKVPFRSKKVETGEESVTELVTVHAYGEPMRMAKPLEFQFTAKATPIIADWGPATGQANDVVSFQGKNPLFGVSVAMNGRECKVKQSEGLYLQCVPPPREAGVSNVEVYFGPDRGFACPAAEAPPLKFTYNLALQSASASDFVDGEAAGPFDGGGALTAGPCSPRTPRSGTLTVVGQGLGNSTVFRLCGGDTWCEREGDVASDPEIFHSGDWSFQTVTCRPGPLDPSKAPGGCRTCDLTAEAADGMFIATLPDAWTYTAPTTQQSTTPEHPIPAGGASTSPMAGAATSTLPPVYIGASPGPALPVPSISPAGAPAASPPIPAMTTAQPMAQSPAPAPVVAVVPATTQAPQKPPQSKEIMQDMAEDVLSGVFKRIGRLLNKSPQKDTPEVPTGLPPPYPTPQISQTLPPPSQVTPPPPLPNEGQGGPPPDEEEGEGDGWDPLSEDDEDFKNEPPLGLTEANSTGTSDFAPAPVPPLAALVRVGRHHSYQAVAKVGEPVLRGAKRR